MIDSGQRWLTTSYIVNWSLVFTQIYGRLQKNFSAKIVQLHEQQYEMATLDIWKKLISTNLIYKVKEQ